MEKTDWENVFKVRLTNIVNENMDKHDVIKTLLVRKLLRNHRKRSFVRIYTEFELENGSKVDIYFEDLKKKNVIIYEIQKDFSSQWLEKKTLEYKDYNVPYMNAVDFIPININELSDNIQELNKQLDKFVI